VGLFSPNSTLLTVSQSLISFMNLVVSVLAPLALVIFFWGLVQYIYHGADSAAHAEARESITWSLIALFVLFSIWGILQLMMVAFFGGSGITVGAGPTS
jgi:hypothetical protein